MNLVEMFKAKKQKYAKSDLIIFSRVLTVSQEVEAHKNPRKYKKDDKNYCFVGKIGENNTIKNVLTGEVYSNVIKTNLQSNPYRVTIGNDTFEAVSLYKSQNRTFFPQYVRLVSSQDYFNDMPEFHKDTPIYKFWEKQNTSLCTAKFINTIVGDINDKVHQQLNERCYENDLNRAEMNLSK